MDIFELKREQLKLAHRLKLQDGFQEIKTIGGADCIQVGNTLLACVTVCAFPSMELKEKKTYILPDPLPYQLWYQAYREMPAIIEAFNQLEEEPDILLVDGPGIMHPRRIGLAAHLGLALNIPTIGITEKLVLGHVENGKILDKGEIIGFEVKTREHARPIYVSPGNLMSLGSALRIVTQTIHYPHKLPEPLHIAHKIARKKAKNPTAEHTF